MYMNLDLYKVFYHTAKAGSISKAARELYISQPAVSQSIKQLEDTIGGMLFFRTPKGILLTKEGEMLFDYVEQAMNYIRLGEAKFNEMKSLDSGRIVIGASDMSCKYLLLPHLERFHKLYPGISIRIVNGTTPEILKSMKKGIVDFGIISTPVSDDEGIDITECMEIQDCFVCGDAYKQLAEKTISLKELSDYPILLLEGSSSTRSFIDSFTRGHGVNLIPEFELATSDLLVQFAERGFGISCVVRNFAADSFQKGSLYEIKIKEPLPSRSLAVATLSRVPLPFAAKRFIALMGISKFIDNNDK
ncbi:MAG: LysR family transcriptional regulator [Bacillota bacterium]